MLPCNRRRLVYTGIVKDRMIDFYNFSTLLTLNIKNGASCFNGLFESYTYDGYNFSSIYRVLC